MITIAIVTLTVTSISLTLTSSYLFLLLGTTLAVFCIVATCYPILTSCQSRGETGVRGPLPTRIDGYFGRNRQTQSQSQYQNPAYPNIYQQQSQSFVYSQPSYAPIMPEYYDSRNPQYYSSQPSNSQNSHPYIASPAFIPSPHQTYNSPYPQNYNQQNSQASYQPAPSQNLPPKKVYQNFQTQQKPTFDSRIDEDASTQATNEEFTARPTKASKRPATTRKPPPPLLNSRFDDRNSASFKKSLNYDSQLSDSMEKFSLEIFDQFCLKLENENFMISPFSIYHLLVLVAEGAAGNTFAEISNKLNLINIGRTRDFQQYLNEALK
jgi:Serpin (serine protease inhibitor)